MSDLDSLLKRNREWAKSKLKEDNNFFNNLVDVQNPEYLWIGCSDSRVPANDILGLQPGEVFVHRNIANQVIHTDFNCLSVVEYAVNILKVKNIIVCGHYGCGGVCASMEQQEFGLVDNWLRHLKDTYYQHREEVDAIEPLEARQSRLCELNVLEQVYNLSKTNIVQKAWQRGQELTIHGWIYSLSDGLLKDLHIQNSCSEDLHRIYQFKS